MEKRSTKPKSHPNTTQADKVKLIKALREKAGYGSVRIALYLNKDHNITLPLSTIGHNIYISDPKCILKKPQVHIPDQICAFHNIRHKIITPSTPKINGKAERTRRRDEEEDNFSDWITQYNWKRPHGGINIQTPILKLYKRLNNYNNSLPVVIEKLAA
ncbi:MAG: hypothetical protein SWO11_07975 [Thermodesulfobacteriota bacterium]|nr:hypothetical protein [Thermodesulfobacteriota bacterium]